MSQIKGKLFFSWMLAVAVSLIMSSGCSDVNKKSVFDADSGNHPDNWVSAHPASYGADPTVCAECHGSDLHGGTSGVSCFSASFDGTSCHANGPVGHPSGWSSPDSHGASAKAAPNAGTTSGFSTCQLCHGANFQGGSTSTSCFSCHGVSAPHSPKPWRGIPGARSHVNTDPANGAVCYDCHKDGLNSTVTPSPLAPAGTTPDCFNNTLCHAIPTTCAYCHTKPPSGTVAPNRAGAHAVHYAAITLSDECNTCHNGAGVGTAKHRNGVVDVLFMSAYSAKSGTAAHNADGTCSKVSCHGGQTTPVWLTGVIDVNTQCTSCHAYGTTEYNSFASGRHNSHVNTYGFICTDCHDATNLAANHFTSLNTTTLEGPASATLKGAVNYNGTTCTNVSCHSSAGPRTW